MPGFDQRYKGKLEGILGSVSQSFGEQYLHPSLEAAAAAYFVKISTQHPFIDGNKRMSVFFTDAFLTLNDVTLSVEWKEMYELAKFVVEEKQHNKDTDKLQQMVGKLFSQNAHAS